MRNFSHSFPIMTLETQLLTAIVLIFSVIIGVSPDDSWLLQRHWVSANFGSALAATPVLSDFNRDGHLDAVVLSFDGELIVLDATSHGEPLPQTAWPAYHHGHHFYAAPILIDLEHDGINEIIICSFDGTIFAYNWKGNLLKSTKLPRFHIQRKLLLASEVELLNILNTAQLEQSNSTVKLTPEVYSSPLLLDLNNDGRVEELVFATNYGVIQSNGTDKNYNFLLGAALIFNVSSFITIKHKFTDCAKRQSEFPPYFLSDPVWFSPPKKPLHIAVTSTRGRLHIWKGLQLAALPNFPYTYGPSTQSPCVIWPQGEPTIILLDHSGNVLALNLRAKDVWEVKVKGSPTAARRWVVGEKEAVVLGTDKGFIYAFDTETGAHLPGYPAANAEHSFHASPLLMSAGDVELVAMMGQHSDTLVITDLKQPNKSHLASFAGEKSFLGPSLLPYKQRDGCSLLLPYSDGAVGCYAPQTLFSSGSASAHRIVELLPYHPLSIYVGANFHSGGIGSTLFVYGDICTLVLHISDLRPNHLYKLRMFLNGKLVHRGELQRSGFHHISFPLLPTDTHGTLLVELQSQLCGTIARDSLWLQRASFIDRQAPVLKFLVLLVCLACIAALAYRLRRDVATRWLDLRTGWGQMRSKWRRQLSRREAPVLPLHQAPVAAPPDLWRPLRLLWRTITTTVRSVGVYFRREQTHRLY